ncbi:flagellar hook protein FlgE [Ferrimonas marina]|uniref:Flagellar hook protein FlgE n=1 Tax=Ferrimonas marina TaxID=299255 RepID=A0A1M5R093_9GAMM|nr:flagellar hook protein FlgE [Ferrimonas marina]SHH19578.1 flagellar hook protein FlgE [Ferrimonas marina]
MSFNIALSGLRTTSQDLNTISHNIANVSTPGFRGARSEFSAVYAGGQPGGVTMANVSQNFDAEGDIMYTGRQLDMAISGNGFFVTENGGSMSYSRAGMFQMDKDGYIVDAYGGVLQGYPVGANGQLLTGSTGGLRIDNGALPASATENIRMGLNLDSRNEDLIAADFDPTDPESYHALNSTKVYDSLGNEHNLTQYYIKTADNTWEVKYELDGVDISPYVNGGAGHTITFDSNGSMTSGGNPSFDIPNTLTDADGNSIFNGAANLAMDLDMSNATQFGSEFAVASMTQDGYTAGELSGIRVDDNGMVYGVYTNGQDQLQGQVVMANFPNPNGLQQTNNTAWTATFSSGQPVMGAAGTGTLGSLYSGGIEGSNVDLTGELVNLMTAQRNYQSNSKVISTQNQLTQALFQAI